MRTRSQQFWVMLVLFATTSVGWIAWQVSIVQERKAVRIMLKERNLGLDGLPAFSANNPTLPWYRTLLGDATTGGIYLDGTAFSKEEVRRIKATLPEIDFFIVNEPHSPANGSESSG